MPDRSKDRHQAAALSGLRVVEFGHYLAGPLAGVFLADQGADVIVVQPPGGSGCDPATSAILQRGKSVQVVDLRDAGAAARVRALVEAADVVIENFRPGVMDRLGFGYARVAAANPGVIYLSLPGFSRHDERSAMPGWEGAISAACGFYSDLSLPGAIFDAPPTYTPLPLPSVYAGVHGAIAVTAALFARIAHGHGDRIEVSLLDAAMSAAAGLVYRVEDQPDRYNMPPAPKKLLDAAAALRMPTALTRGRLGHGLSGSTAWLGELTNRFSPPLFANYRCADGRSLFVCAMDNEKHVAGLLAVTGLAGKAADLGFVPGDCLDVPPSSTNINAYRGASPRWLSLRSALARAFRRRPALEWEQRLTEAGVPAAVQRTTAEWIEHALALGNGIVRRAGDHVEPGRQVDVTAAGLTDPEIATGTWPHVRTFGPVVTDSRPATGWLDGITVLDLSNVIAGPSCARTLAELGADVIQIVPPVPKMGPRQTLHFGLEVNPGKRSIAVDLATDAGQGVLREMIARADVLTHNCLPHQAIRLGFDPDSAHRVDRRVITVAMTAHGGPDPAVSDVLPGYDPTLQAAAGIMTRYGGQRTPALHGLASCIDYFTGYSGAFAAILGLIARSRGGYDISARTSLARMATWIQLPFLNGDGSEPGGLDARGTGPGDQIHRARDGWLFVSAGADRTRTPGAGAPADLPARIARYTVAEAVRYALEQEWAAHPIVTGRMMRRAAVAAARNPADSDAESKESPSGRVEFVEHPSGLRYWVPVADWVRSDYTPRRSLSPAPFPGQHTSEILAELGHSLQDIDELLDDAIVADHWATGGDYLPI
ncbi:CoA transferase [Nocardia sp. NPDC006630]|uniref:CoA transferase n=1 Tax=Nocardia sp. NPDC006630 TaxID=3157181 RepID=UPI0033B0B65A